MNRQQFMQAMEIYLRPMDPLERTELLADYDQHFELGLQEGRIEEEIARELGKPDEIAKEVLGDRFHMFHMTEPDAYNRATHAGTQSSSSIAQAPRASNRAAQKFFTAIGLIFLNLILGIPLGLTLWSVWLTIASLSLLALAPVAAIIDYVFLNHLEKAEIFVAIGLFGVGILFAIASKYVFKAFKIITIQYIGWHRKIMRGDASI